MFPGRTVGSAQKVAISGEGQPGDDNSRDDGCEIPFAAGTQGFLMRLLLLRPYDALSGHWRPDVPGAAGEMSASGCRAMAIAANSSCRRKT
jgi:hypothetical protein